MEKQKLTTNIPQDEVVIAYLEHERELWLPLHARAVRAGGMNAEFNAAEAEGTAGSYVAMISQFFGTTNKPLIFRVLR